MSWHPGRITGWLNGEQVALREYVDEPLPTTLQISPDRDTLLRMRISTCG